MRSSGLATLLLIVAGACAEQNNPIPDPEPDETGESGSGGSTETGGKTSSSGGSLPKSGTTFGGKPAATGGTTANNNAGGAGGDDTGEAGDTGAGGTAAAGGKASGGSAGKSNGGASGSAGAGGKGGSGGSGGSSGSSSGGTQGAGGSCTTSPNGPIAGLSARYQGEIKDAMNTGIGSKLIIANQGPSTLNLADLKLRYYLTNEVQAAINKTINWAWYRPNAGGNQVDKKSKVNFNVVAMGCSASNANAYFEFTFTADAGLLEPGYQIYFSWTANNAASQNFVQTNDYSFDANAVEGTDDAKIVVLQNSGTRVWGTEP